MAALKSSAVTVPVRSLQAWCRTLVRAVGSSQEEAAAVADNLVLSNVKGHDSHGVGYLGLYLRAAATGALPVNLPGPTVLGDAGNLITLDGRGGFGQIMARDAVDLGIERARERGGAAVVALRNSHHVARVGAWAERVTAAGMVSIHFVNVGAHAPLVAPHNGADARLGTNPFAVGFPGDPPLVLDFATSHVALGKVREAMGRGEPMEPGALIDSQGLPTNDPSVMFEDGPGTPRDGAQLGALLPAGGHKGGGLALMCELLGAVLSGGRSIAPHHPRGGGIILNSMTSIVIDPSACADVTAFLPQEVAAVCDYVRASPPRPGSSERVQLPGEPEIATAAEREKHGIPLSRGTFEDLRAVGRELDVEEPEDITRCDA